MSLATHFIKIAAVCTAALLSACGGGGGGGGGAAEAGRSPMRAPSRSRSPMRPACGYNQINVTLQKVRVHQSATAADSDTGWSEIVLSPAQRIDLLSLTNGSVAELGSVLLPVGNYKQMSLVLASNDADDSARELRRAAHWSRDGIGVAGEPAGRLQARGQHRRRQGPDLRLRHRLRRLQLGRAPRPAGHGLRPQPALLGRASRLDNRHERDRLHLDFARHTDDARLPAVGRPRLAQGRALDGARFDRQVRPLPGACRNLQPRHQRAQPRGHCGHRRSRGR